MTATIQQKGSVKAYAAPFVALYEATADARGFFESVLGFEGMAGRWFRVTAATQRRFFGNVPFGKRSIMIEESGKITVFKSQAFGKDWDTWELFFDQSAKTWRNWSDRSEIRVLPCQF